MSNEELVVLYQEGDNKALQELIENNKGIIYKLVKQYYKEYLKVTREDVEQSAILGLIKAAKQYDINNSKKAKFITYGIYFIDREICNCVLGRSDKERENNKLYNMCTSLNVPVGEDGNTELQELIEGVDYEFENVDHREYVRQLRKDLDKAMQDNNTLMERQILKYRYGWDSEPMLLADVGELFNFNANKVRNIEKSALRKLRYSKWSRENAKEYRKDGYVSDEYAKVLRYNGINV